MKKKLLAMLLAGCMALSLAACGNEGAENTTEQAGDAATEQTEDAATEDTTEVDTSALGTSTVTELGEYKGLTYVPMDTTVTDEEVEAEIQYMLTNNPLKESQDVVGEDSVVNIDYVGTKDGVAFDGGTAEGQELDIANSHYIEGFAESIVGMKVGETKDCPMTFPEDYGVEDLNGAEVVFTITVNECWKNIPAELNDEFADSQGYESVDALYAAVREYFEASKQEEAENDMKYQLVEDLISKSTFDLNEAEIELYLNDLLTQYESYASYYGYDLETYATLATGMTMEAFEAECRESAIYSIQSGLLQDAVVAAEGLEFTEEEYNTKAQEYMTYYGYTSLEDFEAAYTKETISSQILADKAMEILVANAVAEAE